MSKEGGNHDNDAGEEDEEALNWYLPLQRRSTDSCSSEQHAYVSFSSHNVEPIYSQFRREDEAGLQPPKINRQVSVQSDETLDSSVAPLDFSDLEHGFDEEFQCLLKEIEPDLTVYKKAKIFKKLSQLVRDFRNAAVTYGKVIIAEKHLEDEKKSIKPSTKDLGGIAGGEKFIAGNILFRFPLDKLSIYGGEEFAAKEANHQLKGVTALYNSNSGLCLPLIAVIKYQGYKLVAMSVLPIRGKQTLIYGSSDAGFHLEDSKLGSNLVKRAAEALNLRKHPVRIRSKRHQLKMIQLPADMEVHHVEEKNRFYAVDFARLFPPQPPRGVMSRLVDESLGFEESNPKISSPLSPISRKGDILVFLLRPEFVRSLKKPLSSDAFSRFAHRTSSGERNEYDLDVIEATKFLLDDVVPSLARELDQEFDSEVEDRTFEVMNAKGREITRRFHKKGVNMRFLGLVCHHVESKAVKRELFLEAFSRVIKALIRGKMRGAHKNVRTAVLTPVIFGAVDVLNNILGKAACGGFENCDCVCVTSCSSFKKEKGKEEEQRRLEFWCSKAHQFLGERFAFPFRSKFDVRRFLIFLSEPMFPGPACLCCACLWRFVTPPSRIFARVQGMCKIKLDPTMQRSCERSLSVEVEPSSSSRSCFDFAEPFQMYDVLDLGVAVSVLPIMEYSQGTEALIRSRNCVWTGHLDDAAHFRERAREQFETGLGICSWDTRLLCNLGMVFEDSNDLKRAIQMYANAAMSNRMQGRAFYYLARICGLQTRVFRRKNKKAASELARDLLSEIYAIPGFHDFIKAEIQQHGFEKESALSRNPLDRLQEFCFERSISLSGEFDDYLKEYANFLHYSVGTDGALEKAMALYEKVLQSNPNHELALKNFAELLFKQAKKKEKIGAHAEAVHLYIRAKDLFKRLRDFLKTDPFSFWSVAVAKLNAYLIVKKYMNAQAVAELDEVMENIEASFEHLEATVNRSIDDGDLVVRYFLVGDQKRACSGACSKLQELALSLCLCAEFHSKRDLVMLTHKCLDWAETICDDQLHVAKSQPAQIGQRDEVSHFQGMKCSILADRLRVYFFIATQDFLLSRKIDERKVAILEEAARSDSRGPTKPFKDSDKVEAVFAKYRQITLGTDHELKYRLHWHEYKGFMSKIN